MDPATTTSGDRRNSERSRDRTLRLGLLTSALTPPESRLTVSASFTIGNRMLNAEGSSSRSSPPDP